MDRRWENVFASSRWEYDIDENRFEYIVRIEVILGDQIYCVRHIVDSCLSEKESRLEEILGFDLLSYLYDKMVDQMDSQLPKEI